MQASIISHFLVLFLINPLWIVSPHSLPSNNSSDVPLVIQNLEDNMVFVNGGTFKMGCSEKKKECMDESLPVHKVTVNSFRINKHEVTIAEFKQFIDRTGHRTSAQKTGYSMAIKWGGLEKISGATWKKDAEGSVRQELNHPVTHVSWEDADAFCKWLSGFTGRKYRLPTEAEWEFASRGGNKSMQYRYSGSNSSETVAWTSENSNNSTHTIAQKAPNELGIYDMSGNLLEYCSDKFDSKYFRKSNENNPTGPSEGSERSVRGGCYLFPQELCGVEMRSGVEPAQGFNFMGFRIASN